MSPDLEKWLSWVEDQADRLDPLKESPVFDPRSGYPGGASIVVLTPTRYRLAQSREEIEPLDQLCREGKVFQVQEWIVENRPVDPPVPVNGGRDEVSLFCAEIHGLGSPNQNW